jgi:hypothetical protein
MKNDFLIEDGKGYGGNYEIKTIHLKTNMVHKRAKSVTSELGGNYLGIMSRGVIEGKKMVEKK